MEGRLIAWARQEHYLTQSADADTGARIAGSMQQRRRLEKQTRQTIVGLAAAARANGAVSDVEHLAARAGTMGDAVMQRPRTTVRPSNTAVAPATAGDIARFLLEED